MQQISEVWRFTGDKYYCLSFFFLAREDDVKYRFVTESFLEKLIRDIKDIYTNAYQPNASKYKDVMRRVRVCSKQETNEVESLLDSIVACLMSRHYIDVYQEMDLSQSKGGSRMPQNSRSLASKQLFFMRECPEFLMRHDYKRQNEIRPSLCKKMLLNTSIIFQEHLPFIIGNENIDDKKNARIEALQFHIKILNHLAIIPLTRKEFLNTSIINQILLILEDEMLINNLGRIDNEKIRMVGQCLTLLYNLAFDNQILSILTTNNGRSICYKLRLVDDKIIQFTSQTLRVMFDSKTVDDLVNPHSLTKTYIEYIDRTVKEPRQPYQGVKLNCILKNLESKLKI